MELFISFKEYFGLGEELDEATKKKVRISPEERRKRAKEYRKSKAKTKREQRKYRKTAQYRKYKRKAAQKAKTGRTSTGKRQREFIN